MAMMKMKPNNKRAAYNSMHKLASLLYRLGVTTCSILAVVQPYDDDGKLHSCYEDEEENDSP